MKVRALSLIALSALTIVAGCSSSAPALSVGGATVDATYSCPPGADNAAYKLNATVDVRNPTSSTVTIKTVTAEMTLEAIAGTWAEKVGDSYDAGSATFAPVSVRAGSSTTLRVTVPSTCTNGKSGNGGKSYGDYRVTLHIATSDGTFTSTSTNMHRIVAS